MNPTRQTKDWGWRHRFVMPFLLFLVSLGTGCTGIPPIQDPIETVFYAEGNKENRTLIVFLPGIHEEPAVLARRGLVQAVRNRHLAIDMVAVGAHLGYYAKREFLVERLKKDVIMPAKARGYSRIWLAGNSLGGLGSLLYVRTYPQDIEGIFILGPYLGGPDLIQEITQAGGLKKWQPGSVSEQDKQRILWTWLKNYQTNAGNRPKLYLAYGRKDKYAAAHTLLAEILPPQQVLTLPGRHRWTTWKKLWGQALDRRLFTARNHQLSTVPALTNK